MTTDPSTDDVGSIESGRRHDGVRQRGRDARDDPHLVTDGGTGGDGDERAEGPRAEDCYEVIDEGDVVVREWNGDASDASQPIRDYCYRGGEAVCAARFVRRGNVWVEASDRTVDGDLEEDADEATIRVEPADATPVADRIDTERVTYVGEEGAEPSRGSVTPSSRDESRNER